MQTHKANEQRIVAADMSRALRKLSDQLGPDAVLLSSRKLPNGVEIIALPAGATPSTEDFAAMHSDRRSGDRRAKERRSDADELAAPASAVKATPSINSKASVHSAASRLAQSIGDLKAPFSDALAFETLQQELQQVKKMLEEKMSAPKVTAPIMPNPVQYILINRILKMGLPLEFARALTDDLDIHHDVHGQANDQAAIDRAWQLCLTRIEAVLPIAKDDIVAAGGVVAFVGPSGAGKSSAISKLATRWLLEHSAKDIAIISHDASSESGAGRMSRFSSMTGIPIFYVDKDHSLVDRIAQCAKRRLVLIDTLSLSPENPDAQQQLAALSVLSQVKTLTVLPATGDRRWITRAIHHYQQLNSVGCLLTHMDQVESIGELVAVLLTEQSPIHYLSDGGLLPKYIQTPQRAKLMNKLFKANEVTSDTDHVVIPTINLHAEDASELATG
jgi:flagellar biosynthesis protein FlhF